MNRYVRYAGFFDTSLLEQIELPAKLLGYLLRRSKSNINRICGHTVRRVCTCARVCAACFVSVGGRGWGCSASLYRTLVAGVGRYFSHEER